MSAQSAFVQSSFLGVRIANSIPELSLKDKSRSPIHASRTRHVGPRRAPVMNARDTSTPISVRRRTALQIVALGTVSVFLPPSVTLADGDYATYKGPVSLGFSFSYPTAWTVKKKPIKTHLSEVIVTSDKEASTTAGLVVDAVKIESIEKFGSPEAVGKKVVDVESKKESVNSASVLGTESMKKDGLTYYILDYVVDSSRGVKRYLAKATITGGQLYVFTAQARNDRFNDETEDTFNKMLDSFTVVKQYL